MIDIQARRYFLPRNLRSTNLSNDSLACCVADYSEVSQDLNCIASPWTSIFPVNETNGPDTIRTVSPNLKV